MSEDKKRPAPSTPQIDFLRRLQVRDTQYSDLSSGFLEPAERHELAQILQASVDEGTTDVVQRRTHSFLVGIGARDTDLKFLTDAERAEVAQLIKLEEPSAPHPKKTKQVAKQTKGNLSGGEFVTIGGVVVSVAAAAYLTYINPVVADAAFWVTFWGALSGIGFIGDARVRSVRQGGSVSIRESVLVTLIWTIGAGVIVLLGGDDTSLVALFSFLGAAGAGRMVLKIDD